MCQALHVSFRLSFILLLKLASPCWRGFIVIVNLKSFSAYPQTSTICECNFLMAWLIVLLLLPSKVIFNSTVKTRRLLWRLFLHTRENRPNSVSTMNFDDQQITFYLDTLSFYTSLCTSTSFNESLPRHCLFSFPTLSFYCMHSTPVTISLIDQLELILLNLISCFYSVWYWVVLSGYIVPRKYGSYITNEDEELKSFRDEFCGYKVKPRATINGDNAAFHFHPEFSEEPWRIDSLIFHL